LCPVLSFFFFAQVNADGVFRYASSKWFTAALQRLAATGIRGVAVDVWVSAGSACTAHAGSSVSGQGGLS
jgi:hypothetical protein